METHALDLLEGLGQAPDSLTVEQLCTTLLENTAYDPSAGQTAYDALVEGRANDRGFALALRLLCQLADLEATVVEGTLQDAARFWLIVYTQEGYRHLDPTAQTPAYATDDAFLDAGYTWDESRYPTCTDYSAQAAQEEEGAQTTEDLALAADTHVGLRAIMRPVG